jgi:hypothetical protein
MRCRSARILITQQLRETPAPEASAALSRHLARCSRCRAEQVELRALAAQLDAGPPAPVPPPAPVAARGWTERLLQSSPRPPVVRQTPLPWPRWAPFTAATGLLFALLIAHSLRPAHRPHGAARERGSRIASLGASDLPVRRRESGGGSKFFDAKTRTEPGEGPQGIPSDLYARAYSAKTAPSPPSRSRVQDDRDGRPDDLAAPNDDPLGEDQRWTSLPIDQWQKIEARVRAVVRVRDDFVTLPFPRLASLSDRAITQAVESYKREAAIVDPRLSREVTCAFKATALSDVCDQLRAETGIQLTAGPSVADEKVTVFCEKLPLREVMRQLSRPFGYTWLRSKREGGDYRYELVQDLRSQLLEEELRNRDRNAALLALEREIDRYQPYLSLSPDEARARATAAAPEEKKLLEKLARYGWGPIQMYFRLSPPELAALRAGQKLVFSADPKPGQQPLPADLARGVLQSVPDRRLIKEGDHYSSSFSFTKDPAFATALPPTAVPEARAYVDLSIGESELGQFTLGGGSGFSIAGTKMFTAGSSGPYAVGMSPAVIKPDNRAAHVRLAGDPSLRRRISVQPQASSGDTRTKTSGAPLKPAADRPPPTAENKVTSADVLEALHQATRLPIVADYYTHLYPAEAVSGQDQSLFDLLNQLADAMRLRWHKEAGTREAGAWLQFRSASYYNDRLKEVPNRLLARWAASRRAGTRLRVGSLTLDDLIEIAQLSDPQLDAASMAEGARELWGLEEWDLARGGIPRRHLRFLAMFTPAQRQLANSPGGLAFTQMSLAQQQQFISLAFAYGPQPPDVRLEDLAGANLQVRYSLPGGYECGAAEGQQHPAEELSVLWAPTREAALQAARRLDPQVAPAQIVPSERALTFLYTRGDPKTRRQAVAVRATMSPPAFPGVSIW